MKNFFSLQSRTAAGAIGGFIVMFLLFAIGIPAAAQVGYAALSFLVWEPVALISIVVVRVGVLIASVMGVWFASDIFTGKV